MKWLLSRIFRFLDEWRAKYDLEYDDDYEDDGIIWTSPTGRQYIQRSVGLDCEEFELLPLYANPDVQRLQELLDLVKDPIEEMWARPLLLDTANPELMGEW